MQLKVIGEDEMGPGSQAASNKDKAGASTRGLQRSEACLQTLFATNKQLTS